ncbi:MAG TPA: holin [Clostridiales bacterium]|nr:holin [Clostridiales bacterium]
MDKQNEILNTIKILAGTTGMFVSELMGGWDMFLKALLLMIIIDYATGVLKAIYLKELSSEIGYKGIIKKVVMLLVVVIACQIDALVGTDNALRTGTIFFWIANEGISILENAAKMGVPVPKQVKDALLKLKNEQEGGR